MVVSVRGRSHIKTTAKRHSDERSHPPRPRGLGPRPTSQSKERRPHPTLVPAALTADPGPLSPPSGVHLASLGPSQMRSWVGGRGDRGAHGGTDRTRTKPTRRRGPRFSTTGADVLGPEVASQHEPPRPWGHQPLRSTGIPVACSAPATGCRRPRAPRSGSPPALGGICPADADRCLRVAPTPPPATGLAECPRLVCHLHSRFGAASVQISSPFLRLGFFASFLSCNVLYVFCMRSLWQICDLRLSFRFLAVGFEELNF